MGFASFHSIFHIQSKFQVDTNITRVNKLYLLIIKSKKKIPNSFIFLIG